MVFIYIVLQIFIFLLVAPLVGGVIKKVKALSQKRKGAPVFQLYFDLLKLFKKSSVVSETSSWIFRVTPYVFFSTALVASLCTPLSVKIFPESFPGGDIILFVSILALGRFFMMSAALDTGSAFGGMGSSREAMVSSLIEPSILVSLLTAGLIAGTTSIPRIMAVMNFIKAPLFHPVFIMIFLALLIIIIAETARIPVDDPSTHLELTMIHEAMILEYSGRQLALMEYGAAIKQLTFITLLINILIPTDRLIAAGLGGALLAILFFVIKVVIAALVIALVEVNAVKVKLFSVPNLAALAFILSLLSFFQYFVLGGSHV